MNQRLCLAVVAIFSSLSLAACTSLPTSSSPSPFDVDAPNAQPVDLAAGGPVADADPESLLSSFLLACAAGASDDYATARLFLTSSSAQTWDPHKLVTIYSTDSTPKVSYSFDPSKTDTLNASISATGVGSVDQNGVLSPAETSSLEARFHLVRENGQWRIDAPADGVVVSQASFTASHELVSLMFLSATGDSLIADPRWYPTRRVETHMLEGLIAGPQSHLSDALVNAIPSGTSISAGGIELSDHVAKVSLNGTLPSDDRGKQLMAWEISQTLQRSGRVNSVEINVGGEALPSSGLPSQPSFDLDSAVAFNSNGLVRIDGRSVSTRILPIAPSSSASLPAVSPVSSSLLAWREDDRLILVDSSTNATRVVDGSQGQYSPSIDRFGWVWDIPRGGNLRASRIDGQNLAIASENQSLNGVSAVRVSPDGARALLLRQVGGSTSAWIAGIERRGSGEPIALTDPEPLAGLSTGVDDVSWAGRSTVVAVRQGGLRVGNDQVDEVSLVTVPVGGFPSVLALPTGTQRLSAGSSSTTMVIRGKDGNYQVRSGALWQSLEGNLRDVNFPG